MLTLCELQSQMREAILASPGRALLDEIVSDRIPALQRVRIYRNHFRVSLKECLAAAFPATRILVGERYFDAMSGLFLSMHPPRDPRLGQYGGAFPRFLAARDELEDTPFAAEVARLEWVIARVTDAADVPALGTDDLARTIAQSGDEFTVHLSPAAMPFDSDWPAHRIRRAALAGGDVEVLAALIQAPAPTRLLLHRDGDGDACEVILDVAGHAALHALRTGRTVAEARRAASASTTGYPVAPLIEFLFQAGLVVGLSSPSVPRRGAT